MSSPFSWFRKNQKFLIGFFGVLLMFVFTISFGIGVEPIVGMFTGQSRLDRPTSRGVVVTWDGGSLNELEMDNLRVRRNLLLQFLGSAQALASQRGALPQSLGGIDQNDSEESLLMTEILAQYARELGIVVSDDAILDFLNQITDGTLNRGELASVLAQSTNRRLSQKQLFNALRDELLSRKAIWFAQRGLFPASPVDSWNYFQRLNREVSAELLALNVADFTNDIPGPSETEIKATYEQYNSQFANPASPEPGFRQRRSLAFGYVRVDREKIEAAEAAKVSEEQIEAYYQENKDEFLVTPPENTDVDTAIQSPATSDSPVDNSDKTGDNAEPPSDAPVTDPLDDFPADDTNDSNQTEDSDDPAQTNAAQKTDGPSVAEGVDSSTESPRQADDAHDAGPVAADADADAGIDIRDLGLDADADAESEKETGGQPSTEPDAMPTHQPLEEVRDDIRKRIALPIAQEIFTSTLEEVQAEVNRFSRVYAKWQYEVQRDPGKPQPNAPDFSQLVADRIGVSVGSTPLVDRIEIGEYDIGQAIDYMMVQGQQPFQLSFADVAFGQSVQPFKARIFPSPMKNDDGQLIYWATEEFVFWTTEEVGEHTPELAEIRDEVIHAIKKRKAFEQLRNEVAQELISKAQSSGKSLKETFPDKSDDIFETGTFSWMTAGQIGGNGDGRPRISSIENVEMAGNDFMSSVFALKEGQLGLASNQPHTTVFVVRLIEESPSGEELRSQFLKSGVTLPVLRIASAENNQLLFDWYRDIQRQFSVRWNRQPQPGRQIN